MEYLTNFWLSQTKETLFGTMGVSEKIIVFVFFFRDYNIFFQIKKYFNVFTQCIVRPTTFNECFVSSNNRQIRDHPILLCPVPLDLDDNRLSTAPAVALFN